jgi:Na+:H+ antiporter, NhaA family
MKTHSLTHPAAFRTSAVGHGLSAPVRFIFDRFLLVPIGAVIALVWANTAGESYFRFAHALAFPVNEIGMALFLALVTQEAVEATMPGGALHSWRRWGTPIVAAAGGLAGAAFVYLSYVFWRDEQVLWQAWPIACAVDLIAAYYVLKLIGSRSSASFVLLLAIAADAFALAVMAAWPAMTPGHLAGAGLLVAGVASAAMMRRSGVQVFWPYFAVSGVLSWFGFLLAGVHPALALVPIVPFMPHASRGLDVFADPEDDSPVHHAEHQWNEIVQVAVFLFALVNAGVLLRAYDTGTWAVMAAALVGRPLGILAAVAIATTIGFHLPRGITWRHLVVIAVATSSGFTLALFFAAGLLPIGAVLQQVKIGALATASGAFAALGLAWILGVGRFHTRRVR